MGLEGIFRAGKKSLTISLPLDEFDDLLSLYPPLGKNLDVIFSVESFGEESQKHSKIELVDRLEKAIKILDNEAFFHYSISFNYMGTEIKDSPGLGGGITINGELYRLEAGPNKCNLIKIAVDEKGHGHPTESIDIRDKESIEDDKLGTININKKKKPFKLKSTLVKLKKFLESVNDDEVTIMVG